MEIPPKCGSSSKRRSIRRAAHNGARQELAGLLAGRLHMEFWGSFLLINFIASRSKVVRSVVHFPKDGAVFLAATGGWPQQQGWWLFLGVNSPAVCSVNPEPAHPHVNLDPKAPESALVLGFTVRKPDFHSGPGRPLGGPCTPRRPKPPIIERPPHCSHPDFWGLIRTLFGSIFD